jgi:hypothetical protein
MIHIVFNEPDKAVLEQAIEMDESLQGEVWVIKDDYAVGPLGDIYSEEGIRQRKDWWREVLADSGVEGSVDDGSVDDTMLVERLLERMQAEPGEIIWIWAAQNKHDVSGYYWLMTRLSDLQGRVFILYLNNLPFINEKGNLFYPQWLSQIMPREFLKARKLARPITPSEFEVDPDEWKKLCHDEPGVRLLEGGKKLVTRGYDHYDADLRKYLTSDWQKASKVITHFLNKNKETTGDMYLLWRLKSLVADGNSFDIQGELKGMRDFEVKAKSAATAAMEEEG